MAQVETAHLLVEGHRAVSDLLRLVEVPLGMAARIDTVVGTRETGTTAAVETGAALLEEVDEEVTTVASANALVAMSLRARTPGTSPLQATGETAARNRLAVSEVPTRTRRSPLLLPTTGMEMHQHL